MTRVQTIAICGVQVPFVRGGAEMLVDGLRAALIARGYTVDVVNLPFKWYPARAIVDHALAWRMVDLTEANGRPVDLVIATKFPSYLVRHPNKVTWLIQQHRQAYDLWGTPWGDLQETADDRRVRELVQQMDATGLPESRAVYTISQNVAGRLARFNGIAGTPLYPPPQHDGRYRTGELGDYIFTASRMETIKRLDLLVQAVARTPGLRCIIAGNGPDRPRIERLIEDLNVSNRVRLAGFVSDDDLIELYACSRAVYYAPYDEDYGYVTVEAFKSGKPVVTCTDSGGVLEFVEDGVTGLVTAPDPDALADALARLAADGVACRRMGEAGMERVAGITWERTVAALVGG